ncbi:MAG: AraC family transcriptional regulator [Oscillospiraceae bacterium]|nr:AraC family transcriptional regulator [Oscillospiraceae bacterium]
MRKEYWASHFDEDSNWRFCGCGYLNCDKNFSCGPYARYPYIIHKVLNGRGYYEVRGKKYSLSANDAFIILPRDAALYYSDPDDPWTFCWICFTGDFVEKHLEKAGIDKDDLKVTVNNNIFENKIKEILERCVDKKENPTAAYFEGCVMECFSAIEESAGNGGGKKFNRQIDGAVAFIDFHCAEGISVSEISEYLGVDRSRVYRLFKDKFGISPEKYILKQRIEKAKTLIANGEPLKSAAYSVGINDVYYFSKLFKKLEGITPSAYKNSVLPKNSK